MFTRFMGVYNSMATGKILQRRCGNERPTYVEVQEGSSRLMFTRSPPERRVAIQ